MENIGALAVLLALAFSLYAILGSLIGKWAKRPLLALSAERAVYCTWALLTAAAGILVYALMTGDFRLSYVAEHSNRTMPAVYKFTAWWGGQGGSLLLWAWLLATYSAVAVWQNRRKFREMMPYVVSTLMVTDAFFIMLVAFVASPFQVISLGKGIIDAGDGQGLNPLLQYWTMVIHPPMLYLGYVGFAVPFAFAVASLITKQPGDAWIHTTRRWTLVTWGFQTTGILLGAGWAYAALGWGGYWAWDPVENASLLPWITATAFLHSVMMQEKKGMMKIWNMVLVASTFFLCIFGTFLTRSGIVQSVHAFAAGPIGQWFVTFLAVGIAATTYLILSRLEYLKSEAQLESVISRESSFMFNNLILVASCFSVLWGTMFPVISEAVTGEKISVDAPFFNRINIPIGMALMFLTGVGPLIAWRKSSMESLKRAFLWPMTAGFLVALILAGFGVRTPYALLSFMLCTFVTGTVAIEFWKGAKAIGSKTGQNLIAAMVELTHRNTRRYGGYLVHMGVVLMFIGFTGNAFNKDATRELQPGESVALGKYVLKVNDVQNGQNENYRWGRMAVQVYQNGQDEGILYPERRFYPASQTQTSEVAIDRKINEDLYVVYDGNANTGDGVILKAYIFPLVSWIWIGYWVVAFGTIVCLIPSKQKLVWPRTQVVGVTGKTAGVHAKTQS